MKRGVERMSACWQTIQQTCLLPYLFNTNNWEIILQNNQQKHRHYYQCTSFGGDITMHSKLNKLASHITFILCSVYQFITYKLPFCWYKWPTCHLLFVLVNPKSSGKMWNHRQNNFKKKQILGLTNEWVLVKIHQSGQLGLTMLLSSESS